MIRGIVKERPGRFLTTRAPIGQHVKIFRQLTTPPGHVEGKSVPKTSEPKMVMPRDMAD